jgi:hypothetical protein
MAIKIAIETATNQTEPKNQSESASDWVTVGSAVADWEGEMVTCDVTETVGSSDRDDVVVGVGSGVGSWVGDGLGEGEGLGVGVAVVILKCTSEETERVTFKPVLKV